MLLIRIACGERRGMTYTKRPCTEYRRKGTGQARWAGALGPRVLLTSTLPFSCSPSWLLAHACPLSQEGAWKRVQGRAATGMGSRHLHLGVLPLAKSGEVGRGGNEAPLCSYVFPGATRGARSHQGHYPCYRARGLWRTPKKPQSTGFIRPSLASGESWEGAIIFPYTESFAARSSGCQGQEGSQLWTAEPRKAGKRACREGGCWRGRPLPRFCACVQHRDGTGRTGYEPSGR